MAHGAGIWIDHRRAVIVALAADGETLQTIESHVEKHPERTGDSPMQGAYEAHQVPADDSRQRALTGDLNRYYDAVIAAVSRDANLLVFGPGEAKGEFHRRIATTAPGAHVLTVQTEDRMTDRQVVAKVRAHFDSGAPRR